MIKIAIVEDNPMLLKNVVEKLSFFEDITIKFKAKNGLELIEKVECINTVQLILMDIEMPKMNGVEATLWVKSKFPHIKVIMLTVFDNDQNIFNAIKAGADGYLLKEVSPQELYNAITQTLDGGAVMTPSIALKTLRMFRDPLPDTIENTEQTKLSKREVDVLEQLSTGLKYNDIAENLFISEGTIRKHVENIYRKLQVNNKMEAVHKARNQKLI